MLNIFGKTFRHCDGITRRDFLKVGALGVGGLTLADLLRAESKAGVGSSTKAVINIHLDGGPPQMDLFDLKPEAPVEIRGEFSPIDTSLPGFQICELMPKIARRADKYAFIRSLVGAAGQHNAFQCLSGWPDKDLKSIGGQPTIGSVLAKLRGSPSDTSPPYVDLMQGRALARNSARSGFLGPAYQPFRPDMSKMFSRALEEAMKKELAALGTDHVTSLSLIDGLSAARLRDRTQLLGGLDRIRRNLDTSGMMDAMDSFTQQATRILTSGRLAEAIDLSKVSPAEIERYTPSTVFTGKRFWTNDGDSAALKLLLARRLIEAGVRCVTISLSDFDTHSDNFPRMRHILPIFDHGLDAMVTDLEDRGMLDDVTIVGWGEFGRTPRIDRKTGGRHHWPAVAPAILAGGGMRVGQVIGATDRNAGTVTERPVDYQDVIATLYHNLGIDLGKTTLVDPTGRPRYLVEWGEPIRELV